MSRAGRLSGLRRGASALENHVADEFLAGRLTRRALLIHARRIGMGAPLLAGLAGRDAGAEPARRGPAGTVIRVASPMPGGAVDPLTVSQDGGVMMLCQTGEFLALDTPDRGLQPMLALRWQPNADCSVWRFALRPGVRFHDGRAMSAADVVATMDRLCDPRQGSNALSVFRGILSPGGARRIDDLTVEFHLDAPDGNFAYAVSSSNYNAIIVPAGDAGDWQDHFTGTGPFRLERFEAGSGASFVRNEAYWGATALPARTEWHFYADQQPQILALEDGQVDVVAQLNVRGAQGILRDGRYGVIDLPSAAQRQIHLRTDVPFLREKRVRQAIALTLDRPAIVHGLLEGRAAIGNDSPFAPLYPMTDPAVAQRRRDVAAARELMRAAGAEDGIDVTLYTERLGEMPDFAVLVQNACAEIGVRVTLRIEDPQSYYGSVQPGQSDWLDSDMGITDFGHRGVPDTILSAGLVSGGPWNASRFADPAFDRLVASYRAATDLPAQRAEAGAIQRMLLDETPVITTYFLDYLLAMAPGVRGVTATAISQVFLADAALT